MPSDYSCRACFNLQRYVFLRETYCKSSLAKSQKLKSDSLLTNGTCAEKDGQYRVEDFYLFELGFLVFNLIYVII